MNLNQKIKILHIIPGLPTGGAERALVRLVETSDRKAFEHHVISLKDKGTQGEKLSESGAAVYELKINHGLGLVSGFLRLRRIIRAFKPDVIHCWMYHGGFVGTFITLQIPKVLGIRHSLHELKKEKWLIRIIIYVLRARSQHFKATVYNSIVSRNQHENLGFYSSHGSVIYNGINTRTYFFDQTTRSQLRKDLAIGEHELVFGQIARYHPMKNHRGFINAFKEMQDKGIQARIIFAGFGLTEHNSEIVNQLHDLNMMDHVLLLGENSHVSLLLNTIDFLVSPSSWGEGFPNVIGEAMACEVPCIVTDVGDSAFIIGDTGEVVSPNDTEALTNAMMKMAALSANERKAMGRRARQRILDLFPLDKSTRAYEMLYQQLQTAKPGKRIE